MGVDTEKAPSGRGPGHRARTAAGIIAFLITLALVLRPVVLHDHSRKSGPTAPATTTTLVDTGPAGQPLPIGISGDWGITLNAAFSGDTLDPDLWRSGWFGTGITGPIDGSELACYSSENAAVSGGVLHLRLTPQSSHCGGMQRPYTGAAVSTDPRDGRSSGGFEYQYGAMEAKINVPGSRGAIANWPVFISLGQLWPDDGEDDVFEGLGGQACFHFHSTHANNLGGCDPSITPGWHTFGVDWTPNLVTWFYDGTAVGHVGVGITSAPMYIVLANTVSGTRGGRQTFAADDLQVAYVRVWKELHGTA